MNLYQIFTSKATEAICWKFNFTFIFVVYSWF